MSFTNSLLPEALIQTLGGFFSVGPKTQQRPKISSPLLKKGLTELVLNRPNGLKLLVRKTVNGLKNRDSGQFWSNFRPLSRFRPNSFSPISPLGPNLVSCIKRGQMLLGFLTRKVNDNV
jgi:hypothetical protein